MNIRYIVRKIINLIRMQRLSRYARSPGFFVLGLPTATQPICIYLNNTDYAHPGDHLFFEPLMRFLVAQGRAVSIVPIPVMQSYFKANGYTVQEEPLSYAFIISKPELMPQVKTFNPNAIYINTACPHIQQPLINHIVQQVAKTLSLSIPTEFNYRPSGFAGPATFDFSFLTKSDYVLFNNYVESGKFRINARKEKKLCDAAIALKTSTGCTLIHVGSAKDKMNDPHPYPFIDIDLRGKTSITDLFHLATLPMIKGAITYDNFIMHLLALNHKKSKVLFRGRFRPSARRFHLQYVNPPFSTNESLIDYL